MPRRRILPPPITYRGRTFATYASALKYARLPNTEQNRLLLSNLQQQPLRTIVINGDINQYNLRDSPLLLRDFETKPTNRQILQGTSKIFATDPPDETPMNIRYTITLVMVFSPPTEQTWSFGGVYEGTKGNFPNFIQDRINDAIPAEGVYVRHIVEITNINNVPLNYNPATNRLQRRIPLDLRNYFSGIAHITGEENCVRAFLKQHYPKMSKKVIDNLGNEEGVSPQELIPFAERYNIKYIAYDINRNIIAQHIPENPSHSYKRLLFIAYDNHIYPFTHTFLTKIHKHPLYVSLEGQELQDRFNEILYEEHVAPSKIELGKENEITSFTHDNVVYFYNPDYEVVQNIATIFGIQDKVNHRIHLTTIGTILAMRDFHEFPKSYFPYDIKKGHYHYNVRPDPSHKTITLDKNKAFSQILKELPYLLECDIRTANHIINPNPNEIVPQYLYIVEPTHKSILLPNLNVYTGSYLLQVRKEGISFKLLEGITTECRPNNFRRMITELYEKVPEKHAKDIVNKMIGRFSSTLPFKTANNVVRLTTEADPGKKFIKYDENYGFELEYYEHPRTYNNLPISIQVKEQQNLLLYRKMKSMKLKTEDIVQVNADSFTYYADKGKRSKLGTSMHEWKLGTYNTHFKNNDYYIGSLLTFSLKGTGTLYQGYAGNGKSTALKNIIKERDLQDYIILSSKHSAIRQHRNEGRPAEVIQKYEYGRALPTQQIIFVEECWLNSRSNWDIITQLHNLGREIIAFGDPYQCAPVGELQQLNSPLFLSSLFKEVITLDKNYRNDFTHEYYNTLLTTTDNTDDLKRHSVPYEDADMIICLRNEIVDKYNELKMKHLGISFGEIGCSVICRSNNLRAKNIYNGFIFTIKDNGECISFNETDETTTYEELEKYFKPAYARTIYSVQGDEFRTIHIAEEDYVYLQKPSFAYTAISRIKTSPSSPSSPS